MLIYKDIISGDELFSDSFPMTLVDDIVYEVQSKMIVVSAVNVDIGANPSQEGTEEDEGVTDPNAITVNAVVDASRLQQTTFDKKSYMAYIKTYMKMILDHIKTNNPERAFTFQKQAQVFTKKILDNFDQYDFFMGVQMAPEGHIALQFYKEDGLIPYFYFWKDGIREEKV